MTESNTLFFITIAGIYILILVAGVLYAAYIYNNPMRDGYTYVSVIIGVGFTLIGILLLNVITLFSPHYLWTILIHPFAAFALTGLPMAAFQEHKRRQVNRRNAELINEVRNGE
jgi:hypothetical protein